MNCWNEIEIEIAARRIVAAEEAGDAVPADLASFVLHAGECFRCGTILAELRDLEWGVRGEGGGAAEDAPVRKSVYGKNRTEPIILSLQLLKSDAGGEGAAGGLDHQYSLAAESGSGNTDNIDREFTFKSDAGDILIRVFPSQSGDQATAVILMPGSVPGLANSPDLPQDPTRYALRFGDTEVAFRENSMATLPGLPEGDVKLVVR